MLRLILCVCMLSPLPRQVRETKSLMTNPSTSAFPKFRMGRLLHYRFRGLLSVHSRYGLQTRQVAYATLYTGGLGGFVTSTAAPIATGWSDPVPGRAFFPLWTSAFSRRTDKSRLRSKPPRRGICVGRVSLRREINAVPFQQGHVSEVPESPSSIVQKSIKLTPSQLPSNLIGNDAITCGNVYSTLWGT